MHIIKQAPGHYPLLVFLKAFVWDRPLFMSTTLPLLKTSILTLRKYGIIISNKTHCRSIQYIQEFYHYSLAGLEHYRLVQMLANIN